MIFVEQAFVQVTGASGGTAGSSASAAKLLFQNASLI